VIVTGANGYIGTRLLQALGERGHKIIAVVRNKNRLRKKVVHSLGDRLVIIEAEFSKSKLPDLSHYTQKVDAASYLLHSMSATGDFADVEARCAERFITWVQSIESAQLVYLGALLPEGYAEGNIKHTLSQHLASRERVHDILKASHIPLTTLRASIIVGSGSASFEIIRDLVEKLPVMLTPKWVRTECQPIAIRNVIFYLVGVIENDACLGQDYDVGGPETLQYSDMLERYAETRGLRRWVIPVPFFSPKLSSHWLQLFTATNYFLAKNLVDSLSMRTVCQDDRIKKIIPQELFTYREAIERAFSKIAQNLVPSTWYGSLVSGSLSHKQLGNVIVPEHGVLVDKRSRKMTASREECIDAIWSLGGNVGWPSMQWAWEVRGMIDKIVGGTGMRRGRRHPDELGSGDALDFWRVILADRARGRLILYAEMKLPGEAWLVYEIHKNSLRQVATFRPRGLLGRLYWYLVYPIHLILFPQMLKRLASGWKHRKCL